MLKHLYRHKRRHMQTRYDKHLTSKHTTPLCMVVRSIPCDANELMGERSTTLKGFDCDLLELYERQAFGRINTL